ncbi:MAG: hypothetical protein J6A89_00325 [Clostridia bacterium]|nr:hypothetical protein [Clostridia bacterium]
MAGFYSIFIVLIIAIIVASYVGMWKCFEKAGEKGWKALIPFYNWYIMYKISGMNPMWFIVNIVAWFVSKGQDLLAEYIENTTIPDYSIVTAFFIISLVAMAAAIFELVLTIICCINFCKSFGKGGGYIAGMILVAPIFYMIIGCGDAKYIGPKGIKQEVETVE